MADGSEESVTGEDISSILTSLIELFNSIQKTQNETSTANAITKNATTTATESAASIKLKQAAQSLLESSENFKQKLGVQELNLKREDTRMKQATTAEDLLTSGQKRSQSALTFEQTQQDRRKKQNLGMSLVKGIAAGLSSRQPQNINQQNLPSLTTPGV